MGKRINSKMIERLKESFRRKKLKYATRVSSSNGMRKEDIIVPMYKGEYYSHGTIPKGGHEINAHCNRCGKKTKHVTIDFKLYECTICNTMEEKL